MSKVVVELKTEDGEPVKLVMPPGFPKNPTPEAVDAYMANITGGYTQEALHAAFDKVADRRNWKFPIDAEIAREEFAITAKAVEFFTSSTLEIAEDRGATLRVKAAGYHRTVGA